MSRRPASLSRRALLAGGLASTGCLLRHSRRLRERAGILESKKLRERGMWAGHLDSPYLSALSPTGEQFALGGPHGRIRIARGFPEPTWVDLPSSDRYTSVLAFDATGQRLATIAWDPGPHLVIYDTATRQMTQRHRLRFEPWAIAGGSDAFLLVGDRDDALEVDFEGHQLRRRHRGHGLLAQWSGRERAYWTVSREEELHVAEQLRTPETRWETKLPTSGVIEAMCSTETGMAFAVRIDGELLIARGSGHGNGFNWRKARHQDTPVDAMCHWPEHGALVMAGGRACTDTGLHCWSENDPGHNHDDALAERLTDLDRAQSWVSGLGIRSDGALVMAGDGLSTLSADTKELAGWTPEGPMRLTGIQLCT